LESDNAGLEVQGLFLVADHDAGDNDFHTGSSEGYFVTPELSENRGTTRAGRLVDKLYQRPLGITNNCSESRDRHN
jgi:hypothetical protein